MAGYGVALAFLGCLGFFAEVLGYLSRPLNTLLGLLLLIPFLSEYPPRKVTRGLRKQWPAWVLAMAAGIGLLYGMGWGRVLLVSLLLGAIRWLRSGEERGRVELRASRTAGIPDHRVRLRRVPLVLARDRGGMVRVGGGGARSRLGGSSRRVGGRPGPHCGGSPRHRSPSHLRRRARCVHTRASPRARPRPTSFSCHSSTSRPTSWAKRRRMGLTAMRSSASFRAAAVAFAISAATFAARVSISASDHSLLNPASQCAGLVDSPY